MDYFDYVDPVLPSYEDVDLTQIGPYGLQFIMWLENHHRVLFGLPEGTPVAGAPTVVANEDLQRTTLTVTNFPGNVLHREVGHIMRPLPGYVSHILGPAGGMATVEFSTRLHASFAHDVLNGYQMIPSYAPLRATLPRPGPSRSIAPGGLWQPSQPQADEIPQMRQ